MIYHDEWTKNVQHKIADIINETNEVNRIKKSIELSNYKVAYYEQFIKDTTHNGSWTKVYNDEYHNALLKLAKLRDDLMDLGYYED